jgi:hypothetical protein
MQKPLFIAFVLLLFCSSCKKNKEVSLANFYLPFDILKESDLLMEYRYKESEDAPFYWYCKHESSDNKGFVFSLQQLDVYGEVLSETKELLVDNGVLLLEQRLIERDTLTSERIETQFDILSDDLLLLKDLDKDFKIISKVSFESNVYENQKTIITKERSFIGDTLIRFQNKEYPAKRFKLMELYDVEEIGHLEIHIRGEEVYAEGLGLVYVNKSAESGQLVEYYLHKCEIVQDE